VYAGNDAVNQTQQRHPAQFLSRARRTNRKTAPFTSLTSEEIRARFGRSVSLVPRPSPDPMPTFPEAEAGLGPVAEEAHSTV
jgi:hypothetical protein